MKRLFLSGCIILASAFALHAQYDAQFSQYFKAMNYYNPAVAGNTDDLNALAFYRLQWLGIPNAPRSFFITADMPLTLGKTRHGAGIIVYTDEAGLFRNTHYATQYACKFKLFNGTLSVGMQLGVVNQSFDGTGVYIPPSDGHVQADDAFPTTKVQAMAFDMNLGLYFSNLDTYLNIVGGIRLDEPAADLAVAMALVSGLRDIPIGEGTVAFGEIGLSGELRSVPRAESRVKEAARMGFTECILPQSCLKQINSCPDSIRLIGVRKLGEAVALIR